MRLNGDPRVLGSGRSFVAELASSEAGATFHNLKSHLL
jgi:hypothetical protein